MEADSHSSITVFHNTSKAQFQVQSSWGRIEGQNQFIPRGEKSTQYPLATKLPHWNHFQPPTQESVWSLIKTDLPLLQRTLPGTSLFLNQLAASLPLSLWWEGLWSRQETPAMGGSPAQPSLVPKTSADLSRWKDRSSLREPYQGSLRQR